MLPRVGFGDVSCSIMMEKWGYQRDQGDGGGNGNRCVGSDPFGRLIRLQRLFFFLERE